MRTSAAIFRALLALAMAGCGDDGDSPTIPDSVDLTGRFVAAVEGTASGAPFTDVVTVSLRQSQTGVTGTFLSEAATGGSVTGTISGGTFTFNLALTFPCQGTYIGSARVEQSGDRLVGSYSGTTPCSGTVDASFTATRTSHDPPADCATATPLALSAPTGGELSTGDCLRAGGRVADRYRFELPAVTPVQLRLTSGAFDAYLELQDATGNVVAADDDFGGGTDSQLDLDLPAGRYDAVVSSYYAGQTGAYRLELRQVFDPCLTLELIRIPESRTGRIEPSDCDGVDLWALHVAAARTVTITMRSGELDALLALVDRYGSLVGADDDGGGGLDARIRVFVQAGDYIIGALAFGGGQGAYTLTLE